MIILPAIDIIDEVPVRLVQGDYSRKTKVASSIKDTAVTFAHQGASWLHMVDLDGAKAQHPVNSGAILDAAIAAGIHTEVGGGIRTMSDIRLYLEGGISRVILGTAALENEELLKEALARYGSRIAVGIDARNGIVALNGWLQSSDQTYQSVAEKMAELGVQTIIATDISRDGTMRGINTAMYSELCQLKHVNVIASGGVGSMDDLQALTHTGVAGVICGKALYEGRINLFEAIARYEKKEGTC